MKLSQLPLKQKRQVASLRLARSEEDVFFDAYNEADQLFSELTSEWNALAQTAARSKNLAQLREAMRKTDRFAKNLAIYVKQMNLG